MQEFLDLLATLPSESLAAIPLSLLGTISVAVRQWVKRREAEQERASDRHAFEEALARQHAALELREREADTTNFTTVVQLLSQTLTKFEETNKRFVARLDTLVNVSAQNSEAMRMIGESNKITLELIKQGSDAAGREAVRITSAIRETHDETRAFVKEQTDPIIAAIESLRKDIPAASRDAFQRELEHFLERAQKLKHDTAPAGEQTVDPSVAPSKDGKAPAVPVKSEGSESQEKKASDS